MELRVSTSAYTGPFEVLLGLVQKKKVPIDALHIQELIDQYLEIAETLEDVELETASDFILTTATLLAIKASTVLSMSDDKRAEEERLDAQEALDLLVAKLCTYQQYSLAAAYLQELESTAQKMHPRSIHPGDAYYNYTQQALDGITLDDLAATAYNVFAQEQDDIRFAEHVAPRRVSLASVISRLKDRILRYRTLSFDDFVAWDTSRENVVASFMAVLDLVKSGDAVVEQAGPFSQLIISDVKGA